MRVILTRPLVSTRNGSSAGSVKAGGDDKPLPPVSPCVVCCGDVGRLSSEHDARAVRRHNRVAEAARFCARGCRDEYPIEPSRSTAAEPGPDHHGLEGTGGTAHKGLKPAFGPDKPRKEDRPIIRYHVQQLRRSDRLPAECFFCRNRGGFGVNHRGKGQEERPNLRRATFKIVPRVKARARLVSAEARRQYPRTREPYSLFRPCAARQTLRTSTYPLNRSS